MEMIPANLCVSAFPVLFVLLQVLECAGFPFHNHLLLCISKYLHDTFWPNTVNKLYQEKIDFHNINWVKKLRHSDEMMVLKVPKHHHAQGSLFPEAGVCCNENSRLAVDRCSYSSAFLHLSKIVVTLQFHKNKQGNVMCWKQEQEEASKI